MSLRHFFQCPAAYRGVLFASLVFTATAAADPAWWTTLAPSPPATPKDYAIARVGQAKHFAFRAMQALDSALAPFNLPDGGAGSEIRKMVNAWRVNPNDPNSAFATSAANGAALNQGQLKAMAKPFYDRLAKLGLWEKGVEISSSSSPAPFNAPPYYVANPTPPNTPTSYWTNPSPTSGVDWSFAPRYPWKFWVPVTHWATTNKTTLALQPVNIGQVKHCFNFDPAQQLTARNMISGSTPVDSDGDGVNNLVERLLGTDPAAASSSPTLSLTALSQDGFTNGQAMGDAAASRFLAQATWGPTWETIQQVKTLGFDAWITQQYNDAFRETGHMMTYNWLDGTQPGMVWQNLWYDWPNQSQSPTPKLYVNSNTGNVATDYASINQRWASYLSGPNVLNDSWRQANDPNERGPFNDASFPKRGIEPYMFYLHWRKLLLDRPTWFQQAANGQFLEGYPTGNLDYTTQPWAYQVWPANRSDAFFTAEQGSAGMDEAWLRRSLYDSDQLRQRMAWALSQILVVSDIASFSKEQASAGHAAPAHYYDMLTHHSFGNFKDLLMAVTFHPLMGAWLTYRNNTVVFDSQTGAEVKIPDENYAREIMQLFSIGLDELNLDGTPKLDSKGQRIPTYTQTDVRQLSRVFTGLQYRTATAAPVQVLPMKMNAQTHDKRSKEFLGLVIAANANATDAQCEKEVRDAVTHIATRPNVAPFISKLLIQHFTTSTPSPGYVKRVSTVFRDNAAAANQLYLVIRAILLDPEARSADTALASTGGGRLKDPMLRLVSLMRAFNAGWAYGNGSYDLRQTGQHPLMGPHWGWGHYVTATSEVSHPNLDFLQYPFTPPSVFSYFLPGYSQPGLIVNARLLSPEFQLVSPSTIMSSIGRVMTDTMDPANPNPSENARLGMNRWRNAAQQVAWLNNVFTQDSVRLSNSSFNLKDKALRLYFQSLTGPGGSTLQGTEISMPRPYSSPPNANPAQPGSTAADAFLDKLNILLCHGRMTAVTRSKLKDSLLGAPSQSSYMSSYDDWRWERAAVQVLWSLPDAAILR